MSLCSGSYLVVSLRQRSTDPSRKFPQVWHGGYTLSPRRKPGSRVSGRGARAVVICRAHCNPASRLSPGKQSFVSGHARTRTGRFSILYRWHLFPKCSILSAWHGVWMTMRRAKSLAELPAVFWRGPRHLRRRFPCKASMLQKKIPRKSRFLGISLMLKSVMAKNQARKSPQMARKRSGGGYAMQLPVFPRAPLTVAALPAPDAAGISDARRARRTPAIRQEPNTLLRE